MPRAETLVASLHARTYSEITMSCLFRLDEKQVQLFNKLQSVIKEMKDQGMVILVPMTKESLAGYLENFDKTANERREVLIEVAELAAKRKS